MSDRRIENARTLASLLNIGSDEAAPLLDIAVAVTFDDADAQAHRVALFLVDILSRTVSKVTLNDRNPVPAVEIVIGRAPAQLACSVRLQVTPEYIRIGGAALPAPIDVAADPILLLAASCYASGVGLRVALASQQLVITAPPLEFGLTIPITAILGTERSWLSRDTVLADTYLAGAGAIGNGFLYALPQLRVRGKLTIVDPDTVSDGNLNRCVWFTEADIDDHKATRLAEYAQRHLSGLELIPKVGTLQALGKEQSDFRWLRRLIVAVDSRRARRRLQTEVPGEVFDASTTGVAEIVLHHHVQPTDRACLSCIYNETANELARESHMAEALGVELADIKRHFVSVDAARRIRTKYPDVPADELEGKAFDSIFKALCSEGRLLSADHRQVLAPFGFVSVLAGTYLAIEFCRRSVLGPAAHDFNYWRVSPWAPPVNDLKQLRGRHDACEFCSNRPLLTAAKRLWGN